MSSDSIPSELFYQILSRLPASSLVKFKCVCKAWRDMIDNHGFIRLHLDRQLLNSFLDGTDDQLVFIDKIKAYGNSSSFVPVKSLLNSSGETETINTIPLHQRNPLNLFNRLDLVIPCNGVMFLSGTLENSSSSILCNLLTGESHKLPEPATRTITGLNTSNLMLMSVGFGYDHAHDDYKVVLLLDPPYLSCMETMIYSLKLDSWRCIKNFPYIIVKSDGIYLNGGLHWIASSTEPFTNKDDLIVGIDLGTEDYFEMRIPLKNIISGQRRFSWQLNVLGGCISLICSYHDADTSIMDLWLMEDYRVESSWSKLFSIATPEYNCYFPVVYSRRRRIVLLENRQFCVGSKLRSPEYVSLDLRDMSITRNVRVDGQATFLIAAHLAIFNVPETLVRLNT